MKRFFLLLFFVILGLCLTSGSNTAHAQACGPYCTPDGFSCGGDPSCCCTGVCNGGGGTCGNAAPTPIPPSGPYIESVTVSPNPIVANDNTTHNITIVTVNPSGTGAGVNTQYVFLNYRYPDFSYYDPAYYRGYIGWSNANFPWWCGTAPCGSIQNALDIITPCTGGGTGAKLNGYGPQYITVIGCSTSTNGIRRTTNLTVRFPITFQSLAVGNTLAGWTQSEYGATDWIPGQQFNAYINPLVQNIQISSPTVTANGVNPYTITMTAVDGNGGADITDQHAIINYGHASGMRGTIGWSSRGFPWWGATLRGTTDCFGGGQAAIYTGAGYGDAYINAISGCTTVTNAANQRITSITLSFNPLYYTNGPATGNYFYGWVADLPVLMQGWVGPYGNFGLADVAPVTENVTLAPQPATPLGTYTVTHQASDTNGYADITTAGAFLNWNRGDLAWSADNFALYGGEGVMKPGSIRDCGGLGGRGAIYQGTGEYGHQYITLNSCTTTNISATQRRVQWNITLNSIYTTPYINTLYGYTAGPAPTYSSDGWEAFTTFPLVIQVRGKILRSTDLSPVQGIVVNPPGICGGANVQTNASGDFTIPNVPSESGMCIRPQLSAGFSAINQINGHPGNPQSYECQFIGDLRNPDPFCNSTQDLSVDDIFDFRAVPVPTYLFQGNVKYDTNNDSCATGTNQAGALITLRNSSGVVVGPTGSGSTSLAGNYGFNAYSGTNYRAGISAIPANYVVKSATLVGGGGTLSGLEYTGIDFTNPAGRTLNWCLSNSGPWFQSGDGDIRISDFLDSLPAGKVISTVPSAAFFSSNSSVNFGAGNTPPGHVINNEFGYNDDPKNKSGLFSYTFFMNRAKVKQQATPLLSGCSAGAACTRTPAQISNLPKGIYWVDGNLTISGAGTYTHQPGAHVLFLINGKLTIDIPADTAIRVPVNQTNAAGEANLLIMAAKDDIDIGSNVGLSAPNPTQCTTAACTNLEGIYTSEKSITLLPKPGSCFTGGAVADNQFNFAGSFVTNSLKPFKVGGPGKFLIRRSLCGANELNFPAMTIQARYDFIPQLTDFYKTPSVRWKEVNP